MGTVSARPRPSQCSSPCRPGGQSSGVHPRQEAGPRRDSGQGAELRLVGGLLCPQPAVPRHLTPPALTTREGGPSCLSGVCVVDDYASDSTELLGPGVQGLLTSHTWGGPVEAGYRSSVGLKVSPKDPWGPRIGQEGDRGEWGEPGAFTHPWSPATRRCCGRDGYHPSRC